MHMARKTFAWSPVRALMKKAGAEMVAREAVDALIDYLEESASQLRSKALEITTHSRRKKITQADMALAIKLM